MNGMGLADAICDIRQELSRAREAAEDQSLKFSIGTVELELEMELQASLGGKADFKWVVVSIGGEAKGQSTTKHKIKLTLNPVTEDGHDLLVAKPSPQPT